MKKRRNDEHSNFKDEFEKLLEDVKCYA